MSQEFIDRATLECLLRANPGFTEEHLAIITPHYQPIVCGIGLDDINDLITEDDPAGFPTDGQKTEILNRYSKYFDWSAAHEELRSAIDYIIEENQ